MLNIWLIARREYLERVRTRGFMIATILIPLLMGGGIAASILIAKHAKSSSHIVIVTPSMQLGTDLESQLKRDTDGGMQVNLISPPSGNTRASLDRAIKKKDIDGYIWLTPVKGARPQISYKQGSSADLATRDTVRDSLEKVLTRERLIEQGMSSADVAAMMTPVEMNGSDAEQDNTSANFAGAYVLF